MITHLQYEDAWKNQDIFEVLIFPSLCVCPSLSMCIYYLEGSANTHHSYYLNCFTAQIQKQVVFPVATTTQISAPLVRGPEEGDAVCVPHTVVQTKTAQQPPD